jgi:hypothetical protein
MSTQNSLAKTVAAKSDSLQIAAGRFGLLGLGSVTVGWTCDLPQGLSQIAFAVSVLGATAGFALNHASTWLSQLKVPATRETVHATTVLLHDLETQARTAPISSNGHKQVTA